MDSDVDGFGNACDADFDQDGASAGSDYFTVLACLDQAVPATGGPPEDPTCEESDLDSDGAVAGTEWQIFLGLFNKAVGPAGLACAGDPLQEPCFVLQGAGDTDNDGAANVADNCVLVRQGATAYSDFDADLDWYGNICDGDLNNDGAATASDRQLTFLSCNGKVVPTTGGPSEDPTCEESDLNDDGVVTGADLDLMNHLVDGVFPGPSGLPCVTDPPTNGSCP